MGEIAEAYINEVKLRGEDIQFLLKLRPVLTRYLTLEDRHRLKQIEAKYVRG